MLKITSWNINSVRLRLDLVIQILHQLQPDVLCLQETKAQDGDFPAAALAEAGWPHQAIRGEKSYNGVAILSRRPLTGIDYQNWAGKEDCRHISAVVDDVRLHNFYVPAGGDEPDRTINEKFGHKLDFLDEMTGHFTAARPERSVLVGDLNIAPLPEDVWSSKQLRNVVSHTDIEREKLLGLIDQGGWHDAVRGHFGPDEILYSWWSYRARDWLASNRGRRLDHVWVSRDLAGRVAAADIHQPARGADKPSDHVPVSVCLSV